MPQQRGAHSNSLRQAIWGGPAARNAINYVVRLGKVHRAARRGTYTLKSTSTPVAPGVDVSEEPNSEGSS